MTSIHEYVRNNDIVKVEEYISSGGDINAIDKLKRTPLHLAAWNGNLDIVTCLLKHNAIIDAKAMDAFNPLHFAVQSNGPQAVECVRLLCKKGKSCGLIHQRVTKGNKTALHLAAPKGNIEIIKILLENGLDPLAKTGSGQSAIDLAKDPKIIRLFSDHIETLSKAKKSSKQPTNEDQEPEKDIETKVEALDKVVAEEKVEKEITQEQKEESRETSIQQASKVVSDTELKSTQIEQPKQLAIASSILSILQKRKDHPSPSSSESKPKEEEPKVQEEQEEVQSLKKPRVL
eukprot:gene3286-3504_t